MPTLKHSLMNQLVKQKNVEVKQKNVEVSKLTH